MPEDEKVKNYIIFTKCTLIVVNFFICGCSLITLIFGLRCIIKNDPFNWTRHDALDGSIQVVFGLLVVGISCLGVLGVLMDKTKFMIVYAVAILAVFLIQIIFGCVTYERSTDLEDIKSELDPIFRESFVIDHNTRELRDDLQIHFECCGAHSYRDYEKNNTRREKLNPNSKYPSSCCKYNEHPCTDPFKTGCTEPYIKGISESIKIIAYVAFGFSIPSAGGAFCAFFVLIAAKCTNSGPTGIS